MSEFVFKPAIRENVGILLGLAGSSGSGKTFSALRIANGIAGDKPFAFIDTENRRALHYADQFNFKHLDLQPPFRPERYAEAIKDADKEGFPVIVVDSMSHEHAGEGGLLDWHEEELERLCRGNDERRDAMTMKAWIAPKMSHKKMVQALLMVRATVILCFRAEEKIEIAKENGKTVIRPKKGVTGLNGWMPICEKNLPYELTCSFLLTADRPGIPHPIKLQEQHRAMFPLDRPITEESGKLIVQWAKGGKISQTKTLNGKTSKQESDKISGEELAINKVKEILNAGGKEYLAGLKNKFGLNPLVVKGGELGVKKEKLSEFVDELDSILTKMKQAA